MERVVLRLDASMLDHASGISLQPAHCTTDVTVYLDDLFDGAGFEQGGCYALFYTEDYAFGS
jgi:hypothetical protein